MGSAVFQVFFADGDSVALYRCSERNGVAASTFADGLGIDGRAAVAADEALRASIGVARRAADGAGVHDDGELVVRLAVNEETSGPAVELSDVIVSLAREDVMCVNHGLSVGECYFFGGSGLLFAMSVAYSGANRT